MHDLMLHARDLQVRLLRCRNAGMPALLGISLQAEATEKQERGGLLGARVLCPEVRDL